MAGFLSTSHFDDAMSSLDTDSQMFQQWVNEGCVDENPPNDANIHHTYNGYQHTYNAEPVSPPWTESQLSSSPENFSFPSSSSSPSDISPSSQFSFEDFPLPGDYSQSPFSFTGFSLPTSSPPAEEIFGQDFFLYEGEVGMMMNIDPSLENSVNQETQFPLFSHNLEYELPGTPSTAPLSPTTPAVISPPPPLRTYPIFHSPQSPAHVVSPLSPTDVESPSCPPRVSSPRSPASRKSRSTINPSSPRKRRPSTSSGITKKHHCNFPGCLKVCERPCDLKKHKKRHEKPFMCRYGGCNSCGFSTEKDRERHEKSKHKKNEHLVCIHCGHSTARKDNMKDHVRRRHADYDLEETMVLIMRTEGAACASPTDQD